MNLQVDLFSDAQICKDMNRSYAVLFKKSFDLNERIKELKGINIPQDYYTQSVLRDIENNKYTLREYRNVLENTCDNLYHLECMGLGKLSRGYTHIVSLEDSLDYILYRLCEADREVIRSIDNYTQLSRAILNLDYQGLENFSLECLMGLDNKLDNFLCRLYEESNKNNDKFINSLFNKIFLTANGILRYLGLSIPKQYSANGVKIILRSKSFSSLCFTSDFILEDIVELTDNEVLKIFTYKPLEYITHLNDERRVIRCLQEA